MTGQNTVIDAKTFDFLHDITENNTKEWFEGHRAAYNDVLANLTDVSLALISGFDKENVGFAAANPDPRRTISRIHRDMRFAKPGKPRFKSEFFLMFKAPAAAPAIAGFYLHVEPGNVYFGGGAFTPQRPELTRIRKRLSNSYEKWLAVVESEPMKRMFPHGLTSPGNVKIAPQGYDPDDPAIEYLRMKGYCANRPMTMARVQESDSITDVVETFRTVRPLVDYLNEAAR
jgi:uncharacterized protein (TIGR02453 family)